MRRELLKWLRCPSCYSTALELHVFEEAGESIVVNGVLVCTDCDMPYRIYNRLPEMLVQEPAWFTMTDEFSTRFQQELAELNLDRGRPDPAKLVDEHKTGQAEIFDEIVHNYSRMTDSVFWREVDRRIANLWRPKLQSASMVVEVGCGNGRISRPLATDGRVVVGVDISRGMLGRAIEASADNESAHYLMGDAENLPLQDELFDACLIYGVLHHLASPPDCIKEVSRVLLRGGSFFALENNRSMFRGLFDLLVRIKQLWEEHPSDHYVMSSDEVKDWGRAAGMSLNTDTMIYLPPHAVNPLGPSNAGKVLQLTDRVFGALPYVKHHGGLLHIRGQRDL